MTELQKLLLGEGETATDALLRTRPHGWWHSCFLEHPSCPPRPQTYRAHFATAMRSSALLTWAGVVGMIHAIVPAFAPFYTSTRVIRAYYALHQSGRHDDEIKREWKERKKRDP